MNKLAIFIGCLLMIGNISFGQQANLLGTWSDASLIGSNAHGNIYNEMWGVAVNGKEYAVIGSTQGTHFIDVTDPANSFEAHFIAGKSTGGQIIHRDYHDHNGYLYAVSDEGFSSLQIMDLSGLPDTVIVEYDKSDLIMQAHNIFIDDEHKLLYAFATRNTVDGYAMRIFSIDDPVNPTFVAQHNTFNGVRIGHVHDGFVKDNIAILNCGGDGLIVVDFSDPINPVTKTFMDTYPQQGYNHSGWPSSNLDYYYMADENHGLDMKVINICDLEDIQVTKTFNAGGGSNSIAHNQVVACNYLYVSYYYEGLVVYDISDPANPTKVLSYDTYEPLNDLRYKGAWGVYPFLPSGNILVSDMQSGLFIFEAIDTMCSGYGITGEFEEDCEKESQVTAIENELLQIEIKVYPSLSQAGNSINLILGKSDFSVERFNVALIDTKGQIIHNWKALLNQKVNELSIPMNIANGMYFLKIESDESFVSKPIIIH